MREADQGVGDTGVARTAGCDGKRPDDSQRTQRVAGQHCLVLGPAFVEVEHGIVGSPRAAIHDRAHEELHRGQGRLTHEVGALLGLGHPLLGRSHIAQQRMIQREIDGARRQSTQRIPLSARQTSRANPWLGSCLIAAWR